MTRERVEAALHPPDECMRGIRRPFQAPALVDRTELFVRLSKRASELAPGGVIGAKGRVS
jgi:hypothetical protein